MWQENGCLWARPGSQAEAVKRHFARNPAYFEHGNRSAPMMVFRTATLSSGGEGGGGGGEGGGSGGSDGGSGGVSDVSVGAEGEVPSVRSPGPAAGGAEGAALGPLAAARLALEASGFVALPVSLSYLRLRCRAHARALAIGKLSMNVIGRCGTLVLCVAC